MRSEKMMDYIIPQTKQAINYMHMMIFSPKHMVIPILPNSPEDGTKNLRLDVGGTTSEGKHVRSRRDPSNLAIWRQRDRQTFLTRAHSRKMWNLSSVAAPHWACRVVEDLLVKQTHPHVQPAFEKQLEKNLHLIRQLQFPDLRKER